MKKIICPYCGDPLQGEEIEDPRLDRDDKPICDGCYQDKCDICEGYFDDDKVNTLDEGEEFCPECRGNEEKMDNPKFDGDFCEADCPFLCEPGANLPCYMCEKYDSFWIDGEEPPELLRWSRCTEEFEYQEAK